MKSLPDNAVEHNEELINAYTQILWKVFFTVLESMGSDFPISQYFFLVYIALKGDIGKPDP